MRSHSSLFALLVCASEASSMKYLTMLMYVSLAVWCYRYLIHCELIFVCRVYSMAFFYSSAWGEVVQFSLRHFLKIMSFSWKTLTSQLSISLFCTSKAAWVTSLKYTFDCHHLYFDIPTSANQSNLCVFHLTLWLKISLQINDPL